MAAVPARVVFVPGIMGTALAHPSPPLSALPHMLALQLSGKPIALWGRNENQEMALYAGAEDTFSARLSETDGRTKPGSGRVFPGDPSIVAESPLTRISGIPLGDDVIPYDEFLLRLESRAPLDLRVFGYDWRLSNAYNALKLRDFLGDQWGMDSPPDDERERVSVVAHSMGGLVARSFIESPQLHGYRFVKQLITVGTPHLGSPVVYTLMTAAAPWLPLPVPEALLGPRRQQELALRLASLAEMMPVYDFVARADREGQREPWRDTLAGLTLHRYPEFGRGPREDVDALSVMLAFRETLVVEEELQAWLAWRRVRYVFRGGLGRLTPMGLVRGLGRAGQPAPDLSLDGDRTVPYRSALAFGSTSRRTARDRSAAAETLRRGMSQHPPLRDTDWLQRQAFNTKKRYPGELANPQEISHDDAMKITDVEAEIARRLNPDAEAIHERPSWGVLMAVGRTLGTATRRHTAPHLVCAAVLQLRPGDRPPLAYVVRHCTLGQRPTLSVLQWRQHRECLATPHPAATDARTGADGRAGCRPPGANWCRRGSPPAPPVATTARATPRTRTRRRRSPRPPARRPAGASPPPSAPAPRPTGRAQPSSRPARARTTPRLSKSRPRRARSARLGASSATPRPTSATPAPKPRQHRGWSRCVADDRAGAGSLARTSVPHRSLGRPTTAGPASTPSEYVTNYRQSVDLWPWRLLRCSLERSPHPRLR